MKNLFKNFTSVLLIFLIIAGVFALLYQPFEKEKEISLTQLVLDINQEKITKIVISGNDVTITYQDGAMAKSKKELEIALSQSLIN